jgi:hypothetical protein
MRLYIYDEQEARHAKHSTGDDPTTVKLPIRDVEGLRTALGQLVREGKTFRRVLWYTHGLPGQIAFGDDRLGMVELLQLRGFEALFPLPTKMYFSGCNVAAGLIGWQFLQMAGDVFLRGGGYTMAWTSTGHGYNEGWRRWLISSHSVHYTGDVRIVTFKSGGTVLEFLSYSGGWLTGSLREQMAITLKLNKIVPPYI